MLVTDWREAKIIITSRLGFHARPVMAFVDTAASFESEITVSKNGREADGKSIMELMTLGAQQGSELLVRARGQDAEDALKIIAELAAREFDENDPPR